jgi:hemoglobin
MTHETATNAAQTLEREDLGEDADAAAAEEARAREIVEAALEAGLRRFYEKVGDDDLIGPIFAERVHDWEAHIRAMTDFWSRALLGTDRYKGQPLAPHAPLALTSAHFERWLALWEDAARETMPPGVAKRVTAMAANMSHCWARALEAITAQLARQDRC